MTDTDPRVPDPLRPVREAFEAFGREDPMYAALSRAGHGEGRWDAEAFFATGQEEIDAVLDYVRDLNLRVGEQRALDFGCAVGRLTQALGRHFKHAVGLDIATSMVERARQLNRHGDRVTYAVNPHPDLRDFPDHSFDFVYTNKVLQHIPPRAQAGYIGEFVRVLRPDGVAVFQTRNGPVIPRGGVRELLYTLNRRHFRRFIQRLRGRHAYEMHFLARETIGEVVAGAGGEIADVVDLSRGKPGKSLRYCVVAR